MDDEEWLTKRFEENRHRLRAVAYRMLGSLSEAEDAVQEAWLRLSRADTSNVENLDGWLTTVVARVCLNSLRSRKRRKEEPLQVDEPLSIREHDFGPEDEAVLADSVGLALLVVLDTLTPAERLAFVMHDMFGVPFDELAPMVGRSPLATRQLASRARRRVQGRSTKSPSDFARQREVVDAFLAASRNGDFDALLLVLDPDVTLRVDGSLMPSGAPNEIHGAPNVASQAAAFSRRARFTAPALVNGDVGFVVAPSGKLLLVGVLDFDLDRGVLVRMDLIADPDKLRELDYAIL
ncbi:MAG: sigma-70 family RNA polymerase sigma factor [Acidimicrobiales bacterium]|jgi:RNA polymerase sigma-70 factor (ECF subfamily)